MTSEAHPIDHGDLLSKPEGADLVAQVLQLRDLLGKHLILHRDLGECPISTKGLGCTPLAVAVITEKGLTRMMGD